MIINQPKYKFGDSFSKKVTVECEGNKHKVVVKHYVVKIQADSTDKGFTYWYTLADKFPSTYINWDYSTGPIEEGKVELIYNIKGTE